MREKNFLNILLTLYVASVIGSATLSLLEGYSPFFVRFFWFNVVLNLIGIFLGIVNLTIISIRAIKKKPFVKAVILWTIFACLCAIPRIYYFTAGSMIALAFAGSDQVVVEGRLLAQECQEQQTSQGCVELVNSYPAITKIHPRRVYVSEDGVLIIEKLHGFGDIAGFYVYPENMGTPEQSGDIRIQNGLYWFESHH